MGSDKGNPMTPGGDMMLDTALRLGLQQMHADQALARLLVYSRGYSESQVAQRLALDLQTLRRMLGQFGEMDAGCAQNRHGACPGAMQLAVSGSITGCTCECHLNS